MKTWPIRRGSRVKGVSAALIVLAMGLAGQRPALAVPPVAFRTPPSFPVGDGPWQIAVADMNADSIPDLATANFDDSTVTVLLGQDGGMFGPAAHFAVDSHPDALAVADFNADGVPDVVTSNGNGWNKPGTLSVLLGQGDGTLGAVTNFTVGRGPRGVTTADFNGDGKVDIATAISGGWTDTNKVDVLLGRGDGTFSPASSFPVPARVRQLAVADFNNDGMPDLALDLGGKVGIFWNDTLPRLAIQPAPGGVRIAWPAWKHYAVAKSPYAKLRPVTMDEVSWTKGFWGDRFHRCRTATIPAVEEGMLHPDNTERLDVLLIAAGLKTGERKSRDWTDGDCYKWIEAMARQFTVTGDAELARKMDYWIGVIAKAQSPDGYLSTNFWNDREQRLQMPYRHEMYNMGHLLTAASVHYQATGKTAFLDVARKNADFLHAQFSPRPARLAHFPWNPSAHMGLIDLYRTTGDGKYLELAKILIGNRGSSPGGGTHRNGGTDQTQDRVPLRDETQAVGHAVCATYLYCGATDLYAETGDEKLLRGLERIWENVTARRLFVTGGVGAGSGLSTRGDPVHEAFLDDYQLPNECYCETCSNIGNAMWNWRLLNATGDARFADTMERVLYNGGLSPVSITQDRFFYCNPLVWDADKKPTHKHRTPERWLTHACYCCPPQMARTLSALQTWAYSVGDSGIWVNLYSGSKLETELPDGPVSLTQTTDYPWDGRVTVRMDVCPQAPFSLVLRIPEWCGEPTITINGTAHTDIPKGGAYAELIRSWKRGDVVELHLPMPVRLLESHPGVVGNRNRVAVMRGPVVYCVELPLAQGGRETWHKGVYFPESIEFTPRRADDLLGGIVVLEGDALTTAGRDHFIREVAAKAGPVRDDRKWEGVLYRPFLGRKLTKPEEGTVSVALVPYYAWANRGVAYMQVWTPLAR